MAIHQFDLARLLMGAEPTSVFCRSYNPAWSWYAGDAAASVIFEFGDQATFTFDGSWCGPGAETSWNGAWRFGTERGTATWDGDGAPVAETVDGVLLPAELPDEPEQIAGSLAEFVSTLRDPAVGRRATPNGEVHTNVLSVTMVEAAVRSAETGQRVALAGVVEDAYEQAVTTEPNAEVRAVLASWASVLEVVGLVSGQAKTPAHQLTSSGEV
jgi:predicted dehydrogenase